MRYAPRESPVARAVLMYNWLSALEKLGGMFGSRWDAGVDRRWVVPDWIPGSVPFTLQLFQKRIVKCQKP